MKESILAEKTMDFAVKIVELHKELAQNKKEHQIADQVKRSGTAIGALLCEAKYAESSADFVHKMKIALKECYETDYWLTLLYKTNYINVEHFEDLSNQNIELRKMLISSINTVQKKEEEKHS